MQDQELLSVCCEKGIDIALSIVWIAFFLKMNLYFLKVLHPNDSVGIKAWFLKGSRRVRIGIGKIKLDLESLPE